MGPDWSLLPPELLQLISEKITSMDHYVHFRFVCQPWRLACTPNPRHLIPQIPWFLCYIGKSHLHVTRFGFGFGSREESERSENNVPPVLTLSLYDYSKSKMHNFELPGVGDVHGHSHGWIVFLKDNELSFINPITSERKNGCFPSLAVPPIVLEFARDGKNKCPSSSSDSEEEERHFILISKVLTSSPSDKDCIAVADFYNKEWGLGFSRIGDTCWTILKRPEYGRGRRRVSDFKCRNELVYVINDKGCLTVYDLRDLSKNIIIDSLSSVKGDRPLRLVIGEGELDGVPLVVKHGSSLNRWSKMFEVYKCVNGPMMSQWMRVKSIGNFMLLLSRNTCEIVSLENIQMDQWEGNHIYYDVESTKNGYSYPDFNIKMVSIENGIVRPTSLGVFCSSTTESCPWFTPRLY